jgi:hypothetical protein
VLQHFGLNTGVPAPGQARVAKQLTGVRKRGSSTGQCFLIRSMVFAGSMVGRRTLVPG